MSALAERWRLVAPIRLKRPRRADLKHDLRAATVLGIESVPDGLANGVLAGVNPIAGLYAYMFGIAGAAVFTGTTFMAVQGTGAMAIIIDDAGVGATENPTRTLVTLSLLTGAIMIGCGLLGASRLLRFVASSVMTGFISAVGVSIVLGQFDNFTGYESSGPNRVARALDTIIHPFRLDPWSVIVGVVTIALILQLRNTRLGSLGLVVAIFAGSAVAQVMNYLGAEVAVVSDVAGIPRALPSPALPALSELPLLVFPALSLAFVAMVQGAAVSAAFVNPDGRLGDADADLIGQGAGNLVAGVFRGMPVGGSMSASSLVTNAGARSRWAMIYTALVMAFVILALADLVEQIAMPALAGLLIVVGAETVRPAAIENVVKTGTIQATTMVVTFLLTLTISLQYGVLVGVGMSMVLYSVRQANRVFIRQLVLHDDGSVDEFEAPDHLPAQQVLVIQPYGSFFFGGAPRLAEQLPVPTETSRGSVVILRFHGRPDVGLSFIDVLEDYARQLREVDSKLMIVTDSPRMVEQMARTRTIEVVGPKNVRLGRPRVFAALSEAHRDATEWVSAKRIGD